MTEKILIVSDLHLTVNFRPKKYEYLKSLFSKFDRIIINGDLWTAYYNTFDEFLQTKWSSLFPLLKSKKTVYLYGNHDREEWLDSRAKIFSEVQSNEYLLEVGNKKYKIIHGHKFLGDSIATDGYLTFWRKYKLDFWKYLLETAFLRTFGRYFYLIAALMNNKVKKISKEMGDIDYLVIGHTHWGEVDQESKFINSGLIHSGVSNYIVILDGQPHMVYERY